MSKPNSDKQNKNHLNNDSSTAYNNTATATCNKNYTYGNAAYTVHNTELWYSSIFLPIYINDYILYTIVNLQLWTSDGVVAISQGDNVAYRGDWGFL